MTTPLEQNESEALKPILNFRVVGAGGAGCSIVAQMAAEYPLQLTYSAVNTDARALADCSIAEKTVLGAKLTRGLGAGGDPEMGRAAALEDFEKCKELFHGTDVVFLIAGLGGGTGTGAAPVLAQIAREAGALVLAVVTMPFDFEGERRKQQAQSGLKQLKAAADAVICVPNQKIFKLIDKEIDARGGFKVANGMVAKSVTGIYRTLTVRGLVNLDFADVCAVTRGRHCESSSACVEASGKKRAEVAVEKLLNHPMLEGVFGDAETVLASIVAGENLSLQEISKIMEPIQAACSKAHVIFGAAVDNDFGEQLEITLIVSRRPDRAEADDAETPQEIKPRFFGEGSAGNSAEAAPRPTRFGLPAPALSEETKEQFLQKKMRGTRRKKITTSNQGQLPLEIIAKGRFEKSEPTIHQGQDLDIPSYVRRGMVLN